MAEIKVPQLFQHKSRTPDIWTVLEKLNLPEVVYIVGGGPNGAEPALRIPDSAFTISCNSAILMPRKFNWAILFDHRLVDNPWWPTFDPKGAKLLYGARLVNRLDMQPKVRQLRPNYYFDYIPNITWPTKMSPKTPKERAATMLQRWRLRGGLNVAGVAIQFAHWGGAKKIVLCGIDQFGRGHWDGEINPDPYDLYETDWPWVEGLERLCAAVGNVYTISKTALRIPEWA